MGPMFRVWGRCRRGPRPEESPGREDSGPQWPGSDFPARSQVGTEAPCLSGGRGRVGVGGGQGRRSAEKGEEHRGWGESKKALEGDRGLGSGPMRDRRRSGGGVCEGRVGAEAPRTPSVLRRDGMISPQRAQGPHLLLKTQMDGRL